MKDCFYFCPEFRIKRWVFCPSIINLNFSFKMKKILLTFVAAFVAVSVSAQLYVGGSLGLASTKIGEGDAKTTYKILPEVGYNLNESLAFGAVLGWGKGNPVSIENTAGMDSYFTVNPYVRYTFMNYRFVNVFVDGGVGYTHYNDADASLVNIGLAPGVSINLNEHLSFETHVGFLGWKHVEPKTGKGSDAFGLAVDGNNITFGLYYNF